VDDTLELDEVLKPSKELSELLASLDRTKVKPWILTNAYITHAKRVLKLLDIEPFFEGSRTKRENTHIGITYCDYGQEVLICKPKKEMFEKAMMEAGVTDKDKCYFVDDSFGTFPWSWQS
jgi:pyrimidine and pyridine-specific 5'-nucleotidase